MVVQSTSICQNCGMCSPHLILTHIHETWVKKIPILFSVSGMYYFAVQNNYCTLSMDSICGVEVVIIAKLVTK